MLTKASRCNIIITSSKNLDVIFLENCGDELEKLVEIGILFDFYGKLLSSKQYMVINLYYINDLSLVEIGDELDVSRQGIFDLLKRAERKLYSYEKKLHLVEKFYSSHSYIQDIRDISRDILKSIEAKDPEVDYIEEKARAIKTICDRVLEISREVI